MNPRDMKSEIEKYTENHELQRIETTYSDEMYPWTAGKAPWSVEQGGTGVVPTGARNNINITALKNSRRGGPFTPNTDSKESIIKQNCVTSFQSLNPSNLEGNIKSINELKHCYTLMQSLLEKAKTYHMVEVHPSHEENVTLAVSEMDVTLEVLKNTPFKETNDQNHRSPTPPQRRIIKRERSVSHERSLSPPRGYHSVSDSHNTRSPSMNIRSSREHDAYDHGRSNDNGRDSRSIRYERERRYSNDRHRDRDERRDSRDRSARR